MVNFDLTPEIVEQLAAATDELFTTDKLIDATSIMDELLRRSELDSRINLINTICDILERLVKRYFELYPDKVAVDETKEMAARIIARMWDRPESELLGAATLLARYYGGNLNALNRDSYRVITTADGSESLLVVALLTTGLSAIVSHEMGLASPGEAIRAAVEW